LPKKTAGILGDDLAVNQKGLWICFFKEIPVLWAITKGSLLNKLMILPLAFLLSAFAPGSSLLSCARAIYLAYEGAENTRILNPYHHSENRVETTI
jgi:predicted DNA repair protein MutK